MPSYRQVDHQMVSHETDVVKLIGSDLSLMHTCSIAAWLLVSWIPHCAYPHADVKMVERSSSHC